MRQSDPARIIEAARGRRIRVMQAAPIPGEDIGVYLSMSVWDLERFLDTVSPPPLTEDSMAARIIGRPQDLTVDDDPWRFELLAGYGEAGFQFRAIVTIPYADVDEVVAMLEADHQP